MKKPSEPKSQLQEVLFYLITRIHIDRRQMMLSVGVLNLPDQIMKLRRRYGLKIDLTEVKVLNKFDREISFGKYSIQDKKAAYLIYKRIQQEQKEKEKTA